jgi:hypothetical protein
MSCSPHRYKEQHTDCLKKNIHQKPSCLFILIITAAVLSELTPLTIQLANWQKMQKKSQQSSGKDILASGDPVSI